MDTVNVTSVRVAQDVAILTKLMGVDEKLLEDAIDPMGTKEKSGNDEPLTVTNMAKALSEQAPRIPSLEEIRAQQQQRGLVVEVERFTLEVSEASVTDGSTTVRAGHARLVYERTRVEIAPKKSDPLVVDLDGDGQYETSGVVGGSAFDIDADGSVDRSSTAAGGDAFLVWDRNGNGRIDDGSELFGDQHGAADGIAELAKYDENGDGLISETDSVWGQLGLWADTNLDGDSRGEAQSLAGAGFTAIDLHRRAVSGTTSGGDAYEGGVTLRRADGTQVGAVDAWLAYG